MQLVYLPDSAVLFFHGQGEGKMRWFDMDQVVVRDLLVPAKATLATSRGRRAVRGYALSLADAIGEFGEVLTQDLPYLPPAYMVWVVALKLAKSLVNRARFKQTLTNRNGAFEMRWMGIWKRRADQRVVDELVGTLEQCGHPDPVDVETGSVWHPRPLLLAFMNDVVDFLVRQRAELSAKDTPPNEVRENEPKQFSRRNRRWTSSFIPAGGVCEGCGSPDCPGAAEGMRSVPTSWRACFRLEVPTEGKTNFILRYLLQSLEDPSLQVLASDIWTNDGRDLEKLGRAFRDPGDAFRYALAKASELFSPIEKSLGLARPEFVELTPNEAWAFIATGSMTLSKIGFGVIVPAEFTAAGRRRFRLRMRVGSTRKTAGVVSNNAGLGMGELVQVDWDAALGDDALTEADLALLAQQKSALVQFRDAWVVVDTLELADVRKRMTSGATTMPVREALRASLAGQAVVGQISVPVVASGTFADLLARLREASSQETIASPLLRATLRPYQSRGLHWLTTMMSLGLGACLADDMGLGKTIQFLACLLHRSGQTPSDERPALLVAPTSVIGNWQREIERFAPSLKVLSYYGAQRSEMLDQVASQPGALLLTTYGLLRRDAERLQKIDWAIVALDEAQNIKNAASTTAKAARHLRATHRFALTGTPVENRLAELWSILDFVNPGLLGPLETFRRDFAVPIERYGDENAASRLRRIVGPFILRRLKSDPAIIQDLPPKNEMKVMCALTREQASLYKAAVDEEMRRIEAAEGIERRGRVLALLTHTKQICNHPAHYLGESGPLPKRSGKLTRLTEMLEEAMSAGDKVLVFTQFREMGDKLVAHLGTALGVEVLFLHGGTSKGARDRMVQRFQEESSGPRVFVLSVKAGGTGLNLTAANHVFHYDRWWNPAVEDQATDRAYRIGQQRAVQVHKFVCAGTVEDRIDRLLEQKRDLAAKVVGSGEQWITEMNTRELRSLFELSENVVTSMDDDEVSVDANSKAKSRRTPRKGAAEVRA